MQLLQRPNLCTCLLDADDQIQRASAGVGPAGGHEDGPQVLQRRHPPRGLHPSHLHEKQVGPDKLTDPALPNLTHSDLTLLNYTYSVFPSLFFGENALARRSALIAWKVCCSLHG